VSDESVEGEEPVGSSSSGAPRGHVAIRRPVFWTIVIAVVLVIGGLSAALAMSQSSTSAAPGTSTSTTETSTSLPVNLTCVQEQAANTYVQIVSVVDHADGSATVTAHPVVLHCGGPDDRQYLPQSAVVTVQLVPHGNVQVLKTYYASNIPATLTQLNSYVAADWDGNIFLVAGPESAATALIAQFHP